MNSHCILKGEGAAADFRLKILLLVLSIIVPFGVMNTIILRSLHGKVRAAISDEDHLSMALGSEEKLAMVGGSFFSTFLINIVMVIMVSAGAVGIVFWIVGPWQKLNKKVIRILGKGSSPPGESNEIQYATDLIDKMDIPPE